MASANDSVNGSWTYGYGGLNRLQTAACSSHCPGQAVGAALDLSWNYDRYGNRWSQAVTAGTAPTPSAPFTGGSNRMDGWSYDAAGNLLYDGAHYYSYDAEGRLISVDGGATASYVYDAEGRRVRRTVGTFVHDLLYDLDGHVMTEMEYDSHYNDWSRGEIYAGGRHLASYMDSTTYFDHGDGLGTERLRTRVDGLPYETCVSLPFGDAQNCTFPNGAGTDSPLHFTGKPRDAATGLDDFGARYNSSTLGRWMTPDWSAQAEPVPYAKLDNPQSLNLYAYVLNNPVTSVDPEGHWPTDVHDEIIDLAFPGLSNHQRTVLKSASFWMDHCLACQTKANDYQHFMRAPGESPESAKLKAEKFIKTKETQARNDAGSIRDAKQIGDTSLGNFGQGLHTVADGTSPAHVDANGNPRSWPGLPTTPGQAKQELEHKNEETHPSPQQMTNSVNAARAAFASTYGGQLCTEAAGRQCGH